MRRIFTERHGPAGLASVVSAHRARWFALPLCLFLQSTSPVVADNKPNAATPWYQGRLYGQSRTVYQYRSSDGESDSDIYEYLYISDRDLLYRHLDFYASGRLHRDLDGTSTSLADDLFASLEDTSRTREDYLYQLYVEAHDRAGNASLRIGRQYIDVADSIHIDGAQLSAFENSTIGGRVFYGRPVSYYSSIPNDWAFGASAIARPWAQNDTRLTYVRYHDDSGNVDDERYVLESQQRLGDEVRTRGEVSQMNGRFESAALDLFYTPNDGDFDCSFRASRWGGAAGNSRAYTPLSQVLGDRAPYTYLSASASKSILSWLYISPEVTARILDAEDEDSHNRDYTRYDLTLSAEPTKAWSASIAGEYWVVQQGDSFFGVSGDIRYRYRKLWEVSAGAGYLHYEYEQTTDFAGTIAAGDVHLSADGTTIEDSPDSYSYFLSGKYNINKMVSVQVRGELEDNSESKERSYRAQTVLVLRI